jgi:chromosome partitioning protein
MIISLVGLQRNLGKTTVAVNLAVGLSELRHNVLLIDSDPQGDALRWHRMADCRVVDMKSCWWADSRPDIEGMAREYAYTVIDTPPASFEMTRTILEVSDLAILPTGPKASDILSNADTVSLVKDAASRNRGLRAMLLICRKPPGSTLKAEAVEALGCHNLIVFETAVHERMTYRTAMIAGLSVLYYPHCEAAMEMRNLCSEVVDSR